MLTIIYIILGWLLGWWNFETHSVFSFILLDFFACYGLICFFKDMREIFYG